MPQHFRTIPPTAQMEHARDPIFCIVGPQGTRFSAMEAIFKFHPLYCSKSSPLALLGSQAFSVWAVGGWFQNAASYIRRKHHYLVGNLSNISTFFFGWRWNSSQFTRQMKMRRRIPNCLPQMFDMWWQSKSFSFLLLLVLLLGALWYFGLLRL